MPNLITTANGNQIDMEALRLKNEKTIAVGNMRVNARGDELSTSTGQVVRPRNERVSEHYRLHTPVPKRRRRTDATDTGAE